MEKEIKNKYECVNAVYFKANDNTNDDMVLVKEKIHKPDGSIEVGLRKIYNFKKPIFIHKEGFRKYKQKKVWKPRSEMDVYYSNEASQVDVMKKALGIPLGKFMSQKQVCRSPYVYGTDISVTSLVKKMYKDKFPNTKSQSTVAVLDIETNVNTVRGEIIAISLTFGKKAIIATTKDFLGTTPLAKERFFQKVEELTPEVIHQRKCKIEFVVADTPGQAIVEVFKRAHEWKPDFITGWNLMGFDIPKIISELEIEKITPADVFSDPSIERRFRTCKYHKGPTSKKSNKGIHHGLAGYEQWHWLQAPSSFFFIDAMCVYFQIRKGAPLEENYKLDTILNKEINRGKVGIKEAEHLDGVDWQRFMQLNYKIEYLVYNLFDCVGIEILDEKTKDLSNKFVIMSGISDFGDYTSNPKRLADSLHFFVQRPPFNGVLGTCSDQMKTELDEHVPTLDDWIVTLPTERLIDNGLNFITELPDYNTKVHGQSSDIDIAAGYPNIEITMNVSRDTTFHELDRIEGLTNKEQRVIGLNMLAGKTNSLAFATKVYRLPRPEVLYEEYKKAA